MIDNGIKNNHLKKTIMTGIMTLPPALSFLELTKFGIYRVLNTNYTEYFGFTHAEV